LIGFFVGPAADFGSWSSPRVTGTNRVGDDFLLTDEAGEPDISAADLAQPYSMRSNGKPATVAFTSRCDRNFANPARLVPPLGPELNVTAITLGL